MNKIHIIQDYTNKIIAVYEEHANIPVLYTQKKDRYKISTHEVRVGIVYEKDVNKLNLDGNSIDWK